ncbi:type VI secretion system baseplate subunit TssG [Tateyamaria omphalii]|uniref:type VI secretion system baseplate subunit TssG n=1 Tax=Tateyamaria omphalii TaxID=299262 RepID=UPI001C995303|nr:type VI secretion system baseplate subunit TssG [Tateyamaria omphalii]MBY5931949.1 type VI secretion system baseplate subunit TssG [Tateyamaria omphalii]
MSHHAQDTFDQLTRAPHRFEPLTALRLADAEAARRGIPMHVSAPPTGALSSTTITRVSVEADAIRVETALAGLVGPLSPLPPAWTEMAAADKRRRAGGMTAFLDLFSGRLAVLFARAAAKYDLPVLLQWAPRRANSILTALHALIGLATHGLEARSPLPDDAILAHAGLLAHRTRSAMALQAMARSHLGLPVRIEQFHPRWQPVPETEQPRLDGSRAMGHDASAGAWLLDRSGQIRLVVGPVRLADFLSLEPGQPRLRDFARLVRFAIGPVLGFDIQVVLDRRDVPETQLGGDGPAVRLGWNAWALGGEASHHATEAIVDGQQALAS